MPAKGLSDSHDDVVGWVALQKVQLLLKKKNKMIVRRMCVCVCLFLNITHLVNML